MVEFGSRILQESEIKYSAADFIAEIVVNKGEYTEEQKKNFVEELKGVMFINYADLINIDLSAIELSDEALADIFRASGTANIHVNPESSFYKFLQKDSQLSKTCRRRMGIREEANNLETYEAVVEQKKSSFHCAIIPAKDFLMLNEYMDITVAKFYHISISNLEDVQAFTQIRDSIKDESAKIFVREGITLEDINTEELQIIDNVKGVNITLSKAESGFYAVGTVGKEAYRGYERKKELDTEELILCAINNVCIPARVLRLIGDEVLEKLTQITLSVETEEDKSVLEEYKKQRLQRKKVSVVASTAIKIPPEILEGLNVNRVMIGVDENWHGKYNEEDYKRIYRELENLTKGIEAESSDYDKFKIIYERLANGLAYDYKAWKWSKQYDPEYSRQAGVNAGIDFTIEREVSRVQNLEALLYDGKTHCGGFSEILKQTLSMVGIEASYTVGQTKEPSGETEEGLHAWNRVNLDGKLYNCDLTWDETSVKRFGIYKKVNLKRVLRNCPNTSKKIMPLYYLKSDKTFAESHTSVNELEGEALEDFDADSYYQKDFRSFLKEVFSGISTRLCKTAEVILGHDISEWEKGIKGEKVIYDRSI